MSLIGTRSIKLNESGQGVIEYLLILIITVLLVGTFIYQFSSAFRKYANNYFGDYVMCLLETGELPGQAGECKELFSAFDINAGKTSTGGNFNNGGIGSGSGSGSGNSGGTGSNSSSKNASKSSSSNSSSSDSGGSSTASSGGSELGVSGGSDSGGLSGKKRSSTQVKSSSNDGPGGGKGREGLKPIGQTSNDGSSSNSGNGGGRRTALGRDFGYAGQEAEKNREDERPATKAVSKDEGEGLRPKKVAIDTSRKPAAVAEKDANGFTLGGFLRILLIAGILIAIFVLFGSQLLAISKGGEK